MAHLTKEQLAVLAIHSGVSRGRFEQQWGDFVEFRDLVQFTAARLGILRPSPQFTTLGLAMLEAKWLGEFEALETLVDHGE